MQRLRLAVILLAIAAGALLVIPVGSFAGSSAQARQANASATTGWSAAGVTFTLVKPTKEDCATITGEAGPATPLGNACVSKPRVNAPGYDWKFGDGSAQRSGALYESSYSWKVPAAIPAAGVEMTSTITGKGLQGNRICPSLSVTGGFGSFQLYKCAESGQTLNESPHWKLKPSIATAGATATLTVWVLDGPVYTYIYRAGPAAATPKKCRPPLRLPASAKAEKKCRYIVRFNFDVLYVVPDGRVERTNGTGTFYVVLSAKDTAACADEGVLLVRHEHEPLSERARDTSIVFRDIGKLCLELKGRGTKTLTAVIRTEVQVKSSSDPDCGPAREGALAIRAGEPFNFVHLFICGHREKYWPVGDQAAQKVKVEIDIKPAGVQ